MPVESASGCTPSCFPEQETSNKIKKREQTLPQTPPLQEGEMPQEYCLLPSLQGRGLREGLFICLAFDGSHTGKNLAFDGLEKSTTTGGDVADLVCQAELGAASYAVTTANQ